MGTITAPLELEAMDFFAGLIAGLRARGHKDRFDFYDRRASTAAVKVFEFLSTREDLDLVFHMRIHRLYGDSTSWSHMVAGGLGGVFIRWTPGGPCEIRMPENWLDFLLERGSIPGDRELWLHCADVFSEAYQNAS